MFFAPITIFSRTFFQVTVTLGKGLCLFCYFMIFPHPQSDFFTSLSQFLSSPQPMVYHGVTTFLLTEMIADRFIILHKLTHQSKNRQHWSRTLERKVHRLFSKDVCGKHYVLKMYCFIFIPGVGGSRQLVGGRHPLVFSSEWCVIVRTAGM